MEPAGFSLPTTAAAAQATHTCARHPDFEAPRFCTGCGAPLCTACHRSAAHRLCPSCKAASGQLPVQVDFGWYMTLLVDSFAYTWPALVRRALPTTCALVLGATVLFLSLYETSSSDGPPRALDESIGLAVVGFFFAWGLAALLQPALSLPLLRPVPGRRRLLGAALGALLPGGLFTGLVVGAGLLSGLASSFAPAAGDAVFVLSSVLTPLFGSLLVLPLLYPSQAAVAFRRAGPLGALLLPFRAGGIAFVQLALVHLGLLMLSYGLLYTVILPALFFVAVSAWAGGMALAVASFVLLCTTLHLQAVFATGTLRYLEDRARPA